MEKSLALGLRPVRPTATVMCFMIYGMVCYTTWLISSIFVWYDVHTPLFPLVVQIELLDLLLQVVVVASLDDLIDTGGHRHVALFHDLPIVVLPASSLKVVLTELQWVEVELDTGVVDHVLGDRHSRGSPVGTECCVAWCVGLASLGVDSEGRELITVV